MCERFLLLTVLAVVLSGCWKSYTCECVAPDGTVIDSRSARYPNKLDARDWCESVDGIYSSRAVCDLK